MKHATAKTAIFLIQVYRVTLSPLLGSACRYTPSCSRYTQTAIERFGPWRGVWLGLCRVGRCHPWRTGGYDPVPVRPAEDPAGSSTHPDSPSTSMDVQRSVART